MANLSTAHVSSSLFADGGRTPTSLAFMILWSPPGCAIAPTTHRSQVRTSGDQYNFLTGYIMLKFGISYQNELIEVHTTTATPRSNMRSDSNAEVARSQKTSPTERNCSRAAEGVEREKNSALSERRTSCRGRMTEQVIPISFEQANRLDRCVITRKGPQSLFLHFQLLY